MEVQVLFRPFFFAAKFSFGGYAGMGDKESFRSSNVKSVERRRILFRPLVLFLYSILYLLFFSYKILHSGLIPKGQNNTYKKNKN
ncbi:MAG: hypothetical protein K8S27_08590 [Candidatus Omnitrophica bacterium]|nr:hypothetical protein [Candidatus Omnitrophota bacterium]